MCNSVFASVLFFAVLSAVYAGSPCPSRDSIFPCLCTEVVQSSQRVTIVFCSAFNNTQDPLNLPQNFGRILIDRFIIADFNSTNEELISLPDQWIKNIRVREIEFNNLNVSQYFLSRNAFANHENIMEKFTVKNCNSLNYVLQGTFVGLATLTTLREIDLSWNRIPEIGYEPFPKDLTNLEKINLSHNKISTLSKEAFSPWVNLREINLSHNQITEIHPNQFRAELSLMDFSYNMISSVPVDLFTNISIHSRVLFSNNNLQTLPLNTWLPAATRTTNLVDVSDNFFACNCDISWIATRDRKNDQIVGTCASPRHLESKSLLDAVLSLKCGDSALNQKKISYD